MAIVIDNPFDQLDLYDLRYYPEHLKDAGRGKDIHKVLLQESHYYENKTENWMTRIFSAKSAKGSTQSRNGWYDAQEKIGEIHNFVKDIEICWKVAENDSWEILGENHTAVSIGLEARYALITSSLNNLAGNTPPVLISRLLEEEILTTEQALTYVELIPDFPQRALATAVVAALQPDKIKREEIFERSFDYIRSIREEIGLAKILVRIAKTVSIPNVLLKLSDMAHGISYATSRAEALLGLLPFLPVEKRRETIETILSAAKEISNETDRTVALIGVSEHLEESLKSEVLKTAFETISSFSTTVEYSQAETLKHFILATNEEMLSRSLAISKKFINESHRATVELAFAARLFIQGKTDEALGIFKRFEDPLFDPQIAWSLTKILPFIPPDLISEILKITLKISSEFYVVDILVELATRLPENLINQAMKTARAIQWADARTRVIVALARRALDYSNYDFYHEAVNAISQGNVSNAAREQALEVLAPYVTKHSLKEIHAVLQKISDDSQQILTALSLSDHLPADKRLSVLEEEVIRAKSIEDENQRGEIIAEIIIRFAQINEFDRALETAFNLRPFDQRARALAGVCASSPENLRNQISHRIMEHWKQRGDEATTGELLKNLAPHLAPSFVFKAVEIISNLDKLYQAKAFVAVTPFMPMGLLHEIIIPLLKSIDSNFTINQFSRDFDKKLLSVAVAVRLAELGDEEEACILAISIADEMARSEAYEKIIPQLSAVNLFRIREAAANFPSELKRQWVDRCLAPRFAALGDDQTASALISGIKNGIQRAVACAHTAKYCGAELRFRTIHHALEVVEIMQVKTGGSGDTWQADVFTNIASVLTLDGLRQSWHLTLNINEGEERRRALSALSSALAKYSRTEVYPFVNTALHLLARRTRKNLLTDVQSLAGLINSLGGTSAAEEIIRAIHHVGRWW